MRLLNETKIDSASKSKYFLGKVISVDEDYIITFSIPNILENLSKYPTAYPMNTDHIKEVKVDDSVFIHQLDTTTQFFMYTPINKNSNTGMYFGGISVDISDGTKLTVHVDTNPKDNSKGHPIDISIDGASGLIEIGNDFYSLNDFFHNLNIALSTLHTEGTQAAQNASAWYNSSVKLEFEKLFKLFK